MGRQRNNPQKKGKEEVSERMLSEKEASQLSDMEFKAIVISKHLVAPEREPRWRRR